MNDDRMTPKALAEIEGLAEYACEDPDDMDRLASEAVPQMATEIRRAWALIQKIYEVADEERFLEVTAVIDAENGGTNEQV